MKSSTLQETNGGVSTLPAMDRELPYSPEAEIAALGGMLIDPDAVAKAIEIVDDSMFYREAHRRLLRAKIGRASCRETVWRRTDESSPSGSDRDDTAPAATHARVGGR